MPDQKAYGGSPKWLLLLFGEKMHFAVVEVVYTSMAADFA
jgi:hypothetical protein